MGTTKVCTVVAEAFLSRDTVDILGVGVAPNTGMRRGQVVNHDAVVRAVRDSVRSAEAAADVDARTGVLSLGGEHLASQTEIGMQDLGSVRLVTEEHVETVRGQGREIQLPPGREVVHVDAADYTLDDRQGIPSPAGLTGRHLEARLNIVTGSTAARTALHECLTAAGLGVHNCVLQSIALGLACLTEEERQLGVVLFSLGGGTTDVAYFRHGALAFQAVVPAGGLSVTRDLAECVGMSEEEAERLKLSHGSVQAPRDSDEEIEYRASVSGELMAAPVAFFREVIAARVEETLELARDRLMVRGCLAAAPCGLVLAGGGSLMPGVADLAKRVFGGMPVRRSEPRRVGSGGEMLRDVGSLTALGLVLLASEWMRAEAAQEVTLGWFQRLVAMLKSILGIGASRDRRTQRRG